MIRAGELRESVTIQSPVAQTNAYGESTIQWQDFASRRAAISGVRFTEQMANTTGPYDVATHDVMFRYLPGLTNEMRVIWKSRTPNRVLDIVSVAEEGNREGHRLVCKEQAP